MKILIVEDERELAKDLKNYLSNQQFQCESAANLNEAMQKIESFDYDCILLDLMLPDGNGLRILEEIKNMKKEDGVIIISAKDSLNDKIDGLKLGADDYLAKPFHPAELTARIESIIRRKKFDSTNTIQQSELLIDLNAKSVSIEGMALSLTKKEYNLLLFFVGNKNRILSKAAIAEHLSGDFSDMFDNHDFIYAHIKNLKKKMKEAGGQDYIKTVYGTGYKWEA